MQKDQTSKDIRGRIPVPPVRITLSPNTPSPDFSSGDEADHSLELDEATLEEHQVPSEIVPLPEPADMVARNEVPACIDFGIQDFLCRVDEEFDASSDTDTSFLDATPPHRFSDGDMERIDPLPVILNSVLKEDVVGGKSNKETSRGEMSNFRVDKVVRSPSSNSIRGILRKSPSNNSMIIVRVPSESSRRYPRPFRRNVSLPAAVFTTRLMSSKAVGFANSVTESMSQESVSSDTKHAPGFDNNSYPALSSVINSRIPPLRARQSTTSTKSDHFSSDSLASSMGTDDLTASGEWGDDGSPDFDLEDGDTPAFTTDVERKSLLLRTMRRLIRQDTTGNFAPPDFHI